MSGDVSPERQTLHDKYLAERDKRADANREAQFVGTEGEFSDFAEDPHAVAAIDRAAVVEEVDVLIVGAGFGGMLTASRLRDAGIEDFLIVDIAGDFGGTWYWNRYPGVRCDIESYIYMPRLEEVGTIPTERYATGAEIFAHSQRFAQHFGLYERALLQTKVERMEWDEAASRWIVTTDRGDRIAARFVSVSQGPLSKVKLPKIPGLRDFRGEIFHSARWDYGVTGGDASGGFAGLAGKRVGIIGTGATAVQIVPAIAEEVGDLFVFQRTPSSVAPRNNQLTDAAWFSSQPDGWLRERADNFMRMIGFMMPDKDLVQDCWTDFFTRFAAQAKARKEAGHEFNMHAVMQAADYEKMDAVRDHVAAVVDNPATAEALKPWYNFLCKRPLYSDDFLQAFNRPNVHLIDTEGRGVERVTGDGLIAEGREFPLDVIVLATGFDVGAPPHKVGEYEVIGRGGATLDEKWRDGVVSLHGTKLSGFPNFVIVGAAAQAIAIFNYTSVLEIQSAHAAALIAKCLAEEVGAFEVTPEAERRWQSEMDAKYIDRSHFYEECTPGFLNNEGNFRERPTYIGGTYGGGPVEYSRIIGEWLERDFASDTRVTGGRERLSA